MTASQQTLPAEKVPASSEDKKGGNFDVSSYQRMQLGVYEVIFAEKHASYSLSLEPLTAPLVQRYHDVRSALPYSWRFLREIYSIAPFIVVLLGMMEILSSIMPTISLYFDNALFSTIETGLAKGKTDVAAVKSALVGRLVCQFLTAALDAMKQRYEVKLRILTLRHFDAALVQVILSKGYVGWEGNYDDESRGYEMDPQDAFGALRNVVTISVSCVGRAWFIVKLARSSSIGPMFMSLSLIQLLPFFDDNQWLMWARGCIWHAIDPVYLRLRAIRSLVDMSWYVPELVGANLDTYVMEEYQRAQQSLGNADTSDIWRLMGKSNPIKDTLISVANDWPTLYYAIGAIRGAAPFQFSTVSSMASASSALRWNLKSLFGGHQGSISQAIVDIKDMYQRLEPKADPTENGHNYPNNETSSDRGMAIELRDVTFKYQASTSIKPAISNLSCKIEPGSLVVIVGANGSGKTSLVKLLTRLHAPTEGDILIDDIPIGDYRVRDLRNATALLSQEHYVLPLPLRENIGIGWAERVTSQVAVEEAARKGGAHKLITSRENGYDTQLEPIYTKCYQHLQPSHPLIKEVYEKWEKSAEVSGGESQRIIASRTFMRIQNGDIRLVVVDEPSAAMDPAGEYELFKNLREARDGKTMIFITHRFGHLTKHADLILCMKDGQLAESGTHAELLSLKGEYHNLYNIQAQAFADEPETSGFSSPASHTTEPLPDS